MDETRPILVTLPDKRRLEVVQGGDEFGVPVFVHNGTPVGPGLLGPHLADARAKGLQLITYARPGYGSSSRLPGRSVADAAQDTVQLADALGIGHFMTWGISGGGPHALALAALFPERVVAAACLAGARPALGTDVPFTAGMGDGNVLEFEAAARGEAALRPFVEAAAQDLLRGDLGGMDSLLPEPDVALLADQTIAQELARLFEDAARRGVDGWIDDDLAFVKAWGFDLKDIRRPVLVWQGGQDLMVPPSHGSFLAMRIPGAEFRLTPEDGHLTVWVTRVGAVHEWLLDHWHA